MEGGRATVEFTVVGLRAAIREGTKPNPFIQAGSSVHTDPASPFFSAHVDLYCHLSFRSPLVSGFFVYHHSYYLVFPIPNNLIFIII